jgi:hypothetical protein
MPAAHWCGGNCWAACSAVSTHRGGCLTPALWNPYTCPLQPAPVRTFSPRMRILTVSSTSGCSSGSSAPACAADDIATPGTPAVPDALRATPLAVRVRDGVPFPAAALSPAAAASSAWDVLLSLPEAALSREATGRAAPPPAAAADVAAALVLPADALTKLPLRPDGAEPEPVGEVTLDCPSGMTFSPMVAAVEPAAAAGGGGVDGTHGGLREGSSLCRPEGPVLGDGCCCCWCS